MAIRGVVTELVLIDPKSSEIKYDMQNYFVDGREIISGFGVSEYNNFRATPIDLQKTTVTQKYKFTFSGVAKNIDMVEEAIENSYLAQYIIWRWGGFTSGGIDNPTEFNLFAECFGAAEEGSTDFTTVTLSFGSYSKTVNADFPGRKIPWQILVPLQLRKP